MIMGGRVDLNDPAKLNLFWLCVCVAFRVASRNSWLDSLGELIDVSLIGKFHKDTPEK